RVEGFRAVVVAVARASEPHGNGDVIQVAAGLESLRRELRGRARGRVQVLHAEQIVARAERHGVLLIPLQVGGVADPLELKGRVAGEGYEEVDGAAARGNQVAVRADSVRLGGGEGVAAGDVRVPERVGDKAREVGPGVLQGVP